jgi:UDP:flavonoid glycosyltransferase YjiC (YdhE family)
MANADLGRLLVPTICALANSDVLVVAATGGRPISDLLDRFGGRLPDNVRAAEFLPYAELLRKTAVMVTNGGFGGVQQALTAGVPLVVAGDTEDKPEVAARVAWAGAGVNLWTGAPSPARLGRAVAKVLRDPRYRLAAQRLQREIATHGDPVPTIIDSLEQRISSAGPAVPASRPLSLASRRDSTDRSAASARRRKPQRRARRARRDAA